MKIQLIAKKITALLIIAIFLVFNGLGSLAQNVQATSINSTFSIQNYYNSIYPNLNDPSNVLRSLTYSQLYNLLNSDGTYVILFGGAWSDNTQADIGYINQVAKEYGVSTIYNFDTRLDQQNANLDIENLPSDSNIAPGTGTGANESIKRIYVDLVNKYFTNLDTNISTDTVSYNYSVTKSSVTTTYSNSAKKLPTPFLFVYSKNHKDGQGVSAPIISSLKTPYSANDFLTNGAVDSTKVNTYKSLVSAILDPISTTVNGKKVATNDTYSNATYITTAFNAAEGATIFYTSDENIVIQPLTYDELKSVLNSKGNYVFLFGGSWCHNTRAAIKFVNQYAKSYHIDAVYTFDWHLDDVAFGTSALDTRNTNSPFANLYVDLTNSYFTNIWTQYSEFGDTTLGATATNVHYINAGGDIISAPKLQVPFAFTYNKEHKDTSGNSAPIISEVNKSVTPSKSYPNGIQELMFDWISTKTTSIQPTYIDANGNMGLNYNDEINALNNAFSPLAVYSLSNLIKQEDTNPVDQNAYTTESYAKYTAALAAAKRIATNTIGTASVDAFVNLQTAFAGLTIKPVATPTATTNSSASFTESTNPKTGGNGFVFPLITLLASSGIGVLTLAKLKKK